jgi:hypothetical protein
VLSARLAAAAAEDRALSEVLGPDLSMELRQAANAACCECARGPTRYAKVVEVRTQPRTHCTFVEQPRFGYRGLTTAHSPTHPTIVRSRHAIPRWKSSRLPWGHCMCSQAPACWSWRRSRCGARLPPAGLWV